jgi:hypothetical protein
VGKGIYAIGSATLEGARGPLMAGASRDSKDPNVRDLPVAELLQRLSGWTVTLLGPH